MNEPQSIEKVLVKLYIEGDLYGDEPRDECVAEAKAAIEAIVREIIGEDLVDYGGQGEEYKPFVNNEKDEQRLRASKYNLKLEKE